MIIGLGNDLIDIRRIEKTLERFGERFLDRVFTPEERRKAGLNDGLVPVVAYDPQRSGAAPFEDVT